MTKKYQTKLTQEELAKWTARLRDPSVTQCFGQYETGPDPNKCYRCGMGVLRNDVLNNGEDARWSEIYASSIWFIITDMNDGEKDSPYDARKNSRTLPQIADWIDEHLLPADVL